ncbi:S8 family serine peptidase [Bacillus sp. RO2]|uniref:S8 family peptidase n=1 Tax=Bacillus sp. RO2 TaxID=2723913 RepID=UPI00145E01B9|nr:S8 family serine peptidase [Bacillus sp. RO2]NMH73914.1 S8 family serine peptidase [Bacillus sp. RO2]
MHKKVIFVILLCFFVFGGIIYISYNRADHSELTLSDLDHNQMLPKAFEMMNISEDELKIKDDKKVKIAIIDSGISKNHPDLDIAIENSINFINEDESVTDEYNHGTAIAGIIAAKDNNIGIVGIAHNTEIFDLKVLNKEGKGEIKNLVEALIWCIENNIDIVNISFGFQNHNDELLYTIEQAIENNIIVVAAAGNTYGIDVDYPAKYDKVISVNSIDYNNTPLNSSGSGKIDYVAPGLEIISTDNKGSYSSFTGNSFSTAYVTAIIANLMSQNLLTTNNGLTDLKNFSHDIYEPGFDSFTGNGILKLSLK